MALCLPRVGRKPALLPSVVLGAGLFSWMYHVHKAEPTFVEGMPRAGVRAPVSLRGAASDYKELSRVEDIIYDSCVVKDGEQELECLRVWDKLKKFHDDAALECDLDDLRCVVLDVLDRLCAGIDGKDGLVLLSKVSSAVLAFREKFKDWDTAFNSADTTESGDLTLEELIVAMDSVNAQMTREEVGLIFVAADTNGDGVISREEFSNFLTAAVFAEEPLRQLQVDSLPKKQPNLEEYLRWTTSGRGGSWAGLAKLTPLRSTLGAPL